MSECYGEWSGDEIEEETNQTFEDSKEKLQTILNDLLKKYPEKKDEIKMIFNEITNH